MKILTLASKANYVYIRQYQTGTTLHLDNYFYVLHKNTFMIIVSVRLTEEELSMYTLATLYSQVPVVINGAIMYTQQIFGNLFAGL